MPGSHEEIFASNSKQLKQTGRFQEELTGFHIIFTCVNAKMNVQEMKKNDLQSQLDTINQEFRMMTTEQMKHIGVVIGWIIMMTQLFNTCDQNL
jgi:hypothetical protein